MDNTVKPLVLIVDDSREILDLVRHLLKKNEYDAVTADSGRKGLEMLEETKPDLILLDVMMPKMDGYEFCEKLQENETTAYIPVIFLTALSERSDMTRAFSAGAVDYLVKPFENDTLMEKINTHLKTCARWGEIARGSFGLATGADLATSVFDRFKEFLFERLELSAEERSELAPVRQSEIYSVSMKIGVKSNQIAEYIADFLDLTYLHHIDPESVRLGVLPAPFCRANLVLPIIRENKTETFAAANPFNMELIDLLEKLSPKSSSLKLSVAAPDSIEALLRSDVVFGEMDLVEIEDGVRRPESGGDADRNMEGADGVSFEIAPLERKNRNAPGGGREFHIQASTENVEDSPVNYIANNILYAAVSERASDIHIEPKKNEVTVRFRVDGDMKDMFTLKNKTGLRLISKFKVMGGLDMAERRRPQDGSLEAVIEDRRFKLRLATTSTPDGESLVVRLLDPTAKPKSLRELGMTDEQTAIMTALTCLTQGLILIVGATGSGKTTTVYSLLSQIDCRTRSLISIEDPVEYRIPYANQQQVNEKAGVTFESLLKSVVRQDPDIIFLGEIRDQYSAKMAMEFASTGHLTISTLHTSNATTAIFRLERLGIERGVMAESILCVIAQRLLKKLCPDCREITCPSPEEIDMLSPYMDEVPSHVAHPKGCPKCNNTGYLGREAIYEIVKLDHAISSMIGSNVPVSKIRRSIHENGGYLISAHAIDKVGEFVFPPEDINRKVLLEEVRSDEDAPRRRESVEADRVEKKTKVKRKPSILIVEDDSDIQALIKTYLGNRNYELTSAQDGIDAMLYMGREQFDLIISDVNMPNLDGFKLVEMMNQKGIDTPVIFLTSRTDEEDEVKGLELGALDYIMKPIKKNVLLLRIEKFFKERMNETVNNRVGC